MLGAAQLVGALLRLAIAVMTRMTVIEGHRIWVPQVDAGPSFFNRCPQPVSVTLPMLDEMYAGVSGGNVIGEVAAYQKATTISYAATLTAVICSVCVVPTLRRRPGRAALAVGTLVLRCRAQTR
jgi:hypothetical protein